MNLYSLVVISKCIYRATYLKYMAWKAKPVLELVNGELSTLTNDTSDLDEYDTCTQWSEFQILKGNNDDNLR
jgi:hypothetical protein